jgi:class 3 adenylate cyclase
MEPAPELASFVELMLRNWGEINANSLVDALSHHPGFLAIGTDPDEWWEGFDTVAAVWRVQMQEFDDIGIVHFEVEKIVAWKEGTVGWVSSSLRLTVGETVNFPLRFTVVVHEEGAFWRIVNWHLSIPVINEEVFGAPLTTTVDEILTMVQSDAPPLSAMASDGSITIVFTDIESSVSLMESLGEQRWLELLNWHDGIVRQQVTIFGGNVVKGQGDGFMLAFPAIGSAAACVVAIQRSLSSGWAGVPVLVRIGMHYGNATAEGGDFFGRTVVVAARVANAAAGGEILVTQAVQEGLGGAFLLEGARSLSLKGLAGNHSAFPLIWR